MTAKRQAQATYDDAYFACELHRHHWFTNNAAKRARRWRVVREMLDPRPADRILEIGCGAGEHAVALARLAGCVVGVDASWAGIARAGTRAAAENIANLRFVAGDAAALPLPEEFVDKVAAIDFVEHVDDEVLGAVLGEVRRVLVPGGTLVIYTPCLTHYVEWLKARNLVLRQIPGHVAVRDPAAYVRLLESAGFAIRSCSFLPSDYPLFSMLDRACASLPGVGRWFRFRICIVAAKPSA